MTDLREAAVEHVDGTKGISRWCNDCGEAFPYPNHRCLSELIKEANSMPETTPFFHFLTNLYGRPGHLALDVNHDGSGAFSIYGRPGGKSGPRQLGRISFTREGIAELHARLGVALAGQPVPEQKPGKPVREAGEFYFNCTCRFESSERFDDLSDATDAAQAHAAEAAKRDDGVTHRVVIGRTR